MNITQSSLYVTARTAEASRLARLTGVGLLLIGGMFMCGAANAGSIYKCPLPNGSYQYTDVPCSGPRASVVHVNAKLDSETPQTGGDRQSTPARSPDGPGGGPPLAATQAGRGKALDGNADRQHGHGSAKPTRSDPRLDSPEDQRVPTHVLQAGDVSPSAYECIAGPKRWIQMAPCPQVSLKDPRDTTYDPSLNSEPERGSYVLLDRVPVRQQPLDKSELCRKLDDNSIPIKHNGSSDVYERNGAKSKYCP
jgi:hypothetical protein